MIAEAKVLHGAGSGPGSAVPARRAGEAAAYQLLAEAHASGVDPLQLTRQSGISNPTAIRYCAELAQITPSIAAHAPQPRSPGRRPSQ